VQMDRVRMRSGREEGVHGQLRREREDAKIDMKKEALKAENSTSRTIANEDRCS